MFAPNSVKGLKIQFETYFFKEETGGAHYCIIKLNKCFEPFFVPLQASNMSAFKMKTEIMQLWNTSDFIQTNGTIIEMN